MGVLCGSSPIKRSAREYYYSFYKYSMGWYIVGQCSKVYRVWSGFALGCVAYSEAAYLWPKIAASLRKPRRQPSTCDKVEQHVDGCKALCASSSFGLLISKMSAKLCHYQQEEREPYAGFFNQSSKGGSTLRYSLPHHTTLFTTTTISK